MKFKTLLLLMTAVTCSAMSGATELSNLEKLERDQTIIHCLAQTARTGITDADVLYSDDANSNALYLIKQRHNSGAGGGLVLKVIKNPRVWGESDNEEVRLLKIFPYSQKSLKKSRRYSGVILAEANRERLNLCVMSELDKAMHHKAVAFASLEKVFPMIFPIHEHMGMTYVSSHSEPVPFIVTDYVMGKPLSSFYFDKVPFIDEATAVEHISANRNEEALNVLIENKRSAAAYSVFLQLLLALKTANEQYGFSHYDLHPGNIIIAKDNWSEGSQLSLVHPITQEAMAVDLSGTPKVKIIDLGTSAIETDNGAMISATDDKFLDRNFTKVLMLRAKSTTMKYAVLGKQVRTLSPDLSMWYLIAHHVLTNETQLSWHSDAETDFVCSDYNTCLAGYLDRAPADMLIEQ
ncbi:hypothetical protein [uncultured Shewanella sp.]|uniref:hypothetical protein n=1 Tax=uncultured Shewanella sp. TaxID=173975 RepID=UPI002611F764|nr:hypothetical protein [uncultured Shewanella sp.]